MQHAIRMVISVIGGFPHQAVIAFFLMSGYLVGGRAFAGIRNGIFQPGRYLLDRTIRLELVIFPALLLTCAVDWIAFHFGTGEHIAASARFAGWWSEVGPWQLTTFVSNVFMMQMIESFSFGTNTALWSISSEFWYYILFPSLLGALHWRGFKRAGAVALSVAIVIMFALSAKEHDPDRPAYFFIYFAVWTAGAFIPFVQGRWREVIGTLCATGAILSFYIQGSPIAFKGDAAIAVFVIGLILLSHAIPGRLAKAPATFFAGYSFSLYAIHFPILICILSFDRYLYDFVSYGPSAYARFALYFIFLNLCAVVFWYATERNTALLRQRIQRSRFMTRGI